MGHRVVDVTREEGLEVLQGGISTAAKHLGIDPRTLYGAASRGEFWPAVRIGKRWLIPIASWRRFLDGRSQLAGSNGNDNQNQSVDRNNRQSGEGEVVA